MMRQTYIKIGLRIVIVIQIHINLEKGDEAKIQKDLCSTL
jgi:hypothetical protein